MPNGYSACRFFINMRSIKLFFLSLLLLCSASIFAQKDFFGIPKLVLNGEEYTLRWSAKTHKVRYVEDFLPKKDSYSRFNSKVSFDFIEADLMASDIADAKMESLGIEKEEGTVAKYNKTVSANGDILIEYTTIDVDDAKIRVAEWNICRYAKVNNGVLLVQMKMREYDVKADKFQSMVDSNREKWIKAVTSYKIPHISIK